MGSRGGRRRRQKGVGLGGEGGEERGWCGEDDEEQRKGEEGKGEGRAAGGRRRGEGRGMGKAEHGAGSWWRVVVHRLGADRWSGDGGWALRGGVGRVPTRARCWVCLHASSTRAGAVVLPAGGGGGWVGAAWGEAGCDDGGVQHQRQCEQLQLLLLLLVCSSALSCGVRGRITLTLHCTRPLAAADGGRRVGGSRSRAKWAAALEERGKGAQLEGPAALSRSLWPCLLSLSLGLSSLSLGLSSLSLGLSSLSLGLSSLSLQARLSLSFSREQQSGELTKPASPRLSAARRRRRGKAEAD